MVYSVKAISVLWVRQGRKEAPRVEDMVGQQPVACVSNTVSRGRQSMVRSQNVKVRTVITASRPFYDAPTGYLAQLGCS